MYDIKVHQRIKQIIAIFSRFGLLDNEGETVFRRTGRRLMVFIFYASFVISLAAGAIRSEYKNELTFLATVVIATGIASIKLIYILWKNEEILAFIQNFCVHSIADREKYVQVNNKLKKLMTFASCFLLALFATAVFVNTLPLAVLSHTRSLPFNIPFPWDWKNNLVVYCVAYSYIVCEVILTAIASLFNVILWYLMFNCSIKYGTLGIQFRDMGVFRTTKATVGNQNISEAEQQKLFLHDLVALIQVHQNLRG